MSRGRRFDEPKLNLKKVFGVLIGLVVMIMVIVSIVKLIKNHHETNQLMGTAYFTVLENNKWGVIDNKGNVVIQPEYDEMITIPNSQKGIFVCTYDVIDNTYKTKVINEKNEQLFSEYEQIEAIDNYDDKSNTWYEDNVLRVKSNGKYGLINFKGEKILDTIYDEIYSLKGIKNSLVIKKDGNTGLCNNYGNIIADTIYKDIKPLGNNYENGYCIVTAENKYGAIAIDKNIIIEPTYEDVKYIGSNQFYAVKVSGKVYLLDNTTKTISQKGYDSIENITGENIIIKSNNAYGIVDKEGNQKVPANYEYLEYAFSNYYIAKKSEKYGVINNEGAVLKECNYKNIMYNKAGEFIRADIDDIESVLLNNNLEEKVTGIVSQIDEDKGYIRVRIGQDYKYYNFKLEEKQNKDLFTSNTLFLIKENGKYGYANKDGKVVVECIYDDAKEQNLYGYCAVQKDGKWGSINSNGAIEQETNVDLTNNLYIDFIQKWHLNVTGDYYTK